MQFKNVIFFIGLVCNLQVVGMVHNESSLSDMQEAQFRLLKDQVASWRYLPQDYRACRFKLLQRISCLPEYQDDEKFKKSCCNSAAFMEKVVSKELSSADRDAYIAANTRGWFAWQKTIRNKKNSEVTEFLKNYKTIHEGFERERLDRIDNLKTTVENFIVNHPTKKSRDDFKMHVMLTRSFSQLKLSCDDGIDFDITPIDDLSGMPLDAMQIESSLRIHELWVRILDAFEDEKRKERIIIKNADVYQLLIKKCNF